MASLPQKHLITVDAYYRMAEVGLLAPRADFYRGKHPAPEDVLLLVEVSDSTLRYDRDVKVPLYARHEIPEVWIVDLQHNELHSFRKPQAGHYLKHGVMRDAGIARVAALPDLQVDLSGLFAV